VQSIPVYLEEDTPGSSVNAVSKLKSVNADTGDHRTEAALNLEITEVVIFLIAYFIKYIYPS
jgi:hypothetical protein